MSILSLSEYKLTMTERICYDKFENDVMLVFNNFSEGAVIAITDLIKKDVQYFEKKGVIFDNKLLNVYCTMYLGLAWSMYRKGKVIQKENDLMSKIALSEMGKNRVDKIILLLKGDANCTKAVEDISIRYFTLYFSRHIKDALSRMEVGDHPEIIYEADLKHLAIGRMKAFSFNILASGIQDEYRILRN